jgi:Trk K+ transport system NAD-binding subunit
VCLTAFLIRREEQVLIPNGDTVLRKNDKLVVTQV